MFPDFRFLLAGGVLHRNGVLHHQNGGKEHYKQSGVKPEGRPLAQQDHAEKDSQEGSNGVKGAGLCGAQILLRHDVEVDAQSVGNEPQQKDAEHPLKAGEHLACGKGNGQTAQAGKAALDNHDLHGAFAADHLGAVVFQSPADTRAQNEQGSRMKGKAV